MFFFFGCSHKKTSFPITLPRSARRLTTLPGTYIVCLDCGREIPYDWDQMKIGKARQNEARGTARRRHPAIPPKRITENRHASTEKADMDERMSEVQSTH